MMRKRSLVCGVCALATILLTGCVVGPNYQKPVVPAPAGYRGQDKATVDSIADLPWWSVFQDAALQGLIKTAIENNRDLRAAAARVDQARELAAASHAAYLPQIGYSGGVSDGKNESLGNVGANGGLSRGSVLGLVQATWEPDVWGRIRRSNEYALAVYLGTEQGRRGVLLSLVGSVAQTYFNLQELDLRLDIARHNVESFRGSLDIFEKRLEGGTASRLETTRAQGALSSVEANIPDLERQIAIQENAMAVLLGALPGEIKRNGTLLEETLPPDVPAGLPSKLLERRPDILEAEMNVKAANAQVGIATADFFPQIGLTTLLGRGSSPLAAIASGSTTVWSTAATFAGPIYYGGALKARQRAAVAHWEDLRNQYEQVAIGAFRDVSNALIAREKLEQVRQHQITAVNAYQDAVTVSLQRYNAGKSGYYEVLAAQEDLYPAELALAQTELDRRLVIVQLYQALGGGWKLADSAWDAPPPATTTKQP